MKQMEVDIEHFIEKVWPLIKGRIKHFDQIKDYEYLIKYKMKHTTTEWYCERCSKEMFLDAHWCSADCAAAWRCRWSPTLGELESTHQEIWGTGDYDPKYDIDTSTVFFGLYGLPDFYTLWRHKGKKAILWTGSDIRHFKDGYLLDIKGRIRISPRPLAQWIRENCESWVENQAEYEALKELGIESKICPSFLGDVNKFEVSYKWNERPKVYTSVSGDDFELYGWDKIPELATQNQDIEFHLYGNTIRPPFLFAKNVYISNVIEHGRVPKEQMNEEIKGMQGALRLLPLEGFSEIIAKSLLMGQYPVSLIEYPHVLPLDKLFLLKASTLPNTLGREWVLKTVNKYPWNQKR